MADLLIVDDDPDVGSVLGELLRLEGHEVRLAFHGAEGLQLIEARRPDLIILDVEMPVVSGPEMSHRMLLHNLGVELIPVLLMSGIPSLEEVAKEVGTPYFVGKPFRLEHFMATLIRALTERKPMDRRVSRSI